MLNILLLEDDILFAQTLKEFLEEEGFNVVLAHRADDAEDLAYEKNFDCFILDINLPDSSGFDVAKNISTQNPVIFLTSRNDKESLIRSYKLGADEFITKPVDFDELLLRLNAVLKRSGNFGRFELDNGFSFDQNTKVLYKNDLVVDLGAMSCVLLGLLIANIGKVVTKEMIEANLYKDKPYSDGSVRVYINNINNCLGKKYIKNVRSMGYVFEKK